MALGVLSNILLEADLTVVQMESYGEVVLAPFRDEEDTIRFRKPELPVEGDTELPSGTYDLAEETGEYTANCTSALKGLFY
ncbi:Tektin-4 [Manis pentadactyla]|nr:Tektin-4 [Manis pentadactyla]